MVIMFVVTTWIYNKSAFDEAGIKEPAPTWNWNDFLEVGRQLNRVKPAGSLWGVRDGPAGGQPGVERWSASIDHRYPFPWLWSADVRYVDEKAGVTFWDQPAPREVLQYLYDLVQRHRIANPPAIGANFRNGAVAIHTNTNPNPSITRDVDGRFEWDVLPRPRHPRTSKAVDIVGGVPVIATAKAKQRGVLTETVQLMTDFYDDQIQEMYISGLDLNSLPPLKSKAQKIGTMPGMPRNWKRILDAIPTGRGYEQVVGFLDMFNAFPPEFAKALNGEATLEQAVINMKRVSDAALQQAVR